MRKKKIAFTLNSESGFYTGCIAPDIVKWNTPQTIQAGNLCWKLVVKKHCIAVFLFLYFFLDIVCFFVPFHFFFLFLFCSAPGRSKNMLIHLKTKANKRLSAVMSRQLGTGYLHQRLHNKDGLLMSRLLKFIKNYWSSYTANVRFLWWSSGTIHHTSIHTTQQISISIVIHSLTSHKQHSNIAHISTHQTLTIHKSEY